MVHFYIKMPVLWMIGGEGFLLSKIEKGYITISIEVDENTEETDSWNLQLKVKNKS